MIKIIQGILQTRQRVTECSQREGKIEPVLQIITGRPEHEALIL